MGKLTQEKIHAIIAVEYFQCMPGDSDHAFLDTELWERIYTKIYDKDPPLEGEHWNELLHRPCNGGIYGGLTLLREIEAYIAKVKKRAV